MERVWEVKKGHILFDMLSVAIWMAMKEKRIREERRREERKMTGTSFLTCKSLVDGERQNKKEEEERDQGMSWWQVNCYTDNMGTFQHIRQIIPHLL